MFDKCWEKCNNVKIFVIIFDLEGIIEIIGIIVDVGNNGCCILVKGFLVLFEEVVF